MSAQDVDLVEGKVNLPPLKKVEPNPPLKKVEPKLPFKKAEPNPPLGNVQRDWRCGAKIAFN